MANNQKKLKAFVRYDGSGRVVASSLILRKNKPRVGRWYQIPEYLCCNGTSPSTTTTTTQGGGVTPTAFVQSYWLNTEDACNTITYGSFVFYSSSPVLEPGIAIFTDAALTIPVTAGLVISSATMAFPILLVDAEGVLSEYTCPEPTTTSTTTTAFVGTYYVAGPNAEVCGDTGPYSLPLIVDPNACSNGGITLAVGTYADYGITNGSVIYINLQNGNVIQVQTFGSSTMSFGCQSCG
jgi:hypothetical protein